MPRTRHFTPGCLNFPGDAEDFVADVLTVERPDDSAPDIGPEISPKERVGEGIGKPRGNSPAETQAALPLEEFPESTSPAEWRRRCPGETTSPAESEPRQLEEISPMEKEASSIDASPGERAERVERSKAVGGVGRDNLSEIDDEDGTDGDEKAGTCLVGRGSCCSLLRGNQLSRGGMKLLAGVLRSHGGPLSKYSVKRAARALSSTTTGAGDACCDTSTICGRAGVAGSLRAPDC